MRKLITTIIIALMTTLYVKAQTEPEITKIEINGSSVSMSGYSFEKTINMELGNSFELKCRAKNKGDHSPAGYNNISFSFPSFTSSYDEGRVDLNEGESSNDMEDNYAEYYGDVYGNYYSYVMVESSDDNDWKGPYIGNAWTGESNNLCVDVEPESYGEFVVYVRVSMSNQESWSSGWNNDPSYSYYEDETDNYVYKLIVNIIDPDIDPVAERESPSSSSIDKMVEEEIDFEVSATDENCDLDEVEWYVDNDKEDTDNFENSEDCSGNEEFSWSFDIEGDYEVKAKVIDDNNNDDIITWDVDVDDNDPTIEREYPVDQNFETGINMEITLKASVYEPDGIGDFDRVEWDVMDVGPNPEYTDNYHWASWANPHTSQFLYTFTEPGNYTIKATVYDNNDDNNSVTWNAEIENPSPEISNLPNQTEQEDCGETTLIDAADYISDLNDDIEDLDVEVDGPDWVNASVESGTTILGYPYHNIIIEPLPDENGTATLTVTVNDGNSSDSDSFQLTIEPVNDAPEWVNINEVHGNEDSGDAPLVDFEVSNLEDVDDDLGDLTVEITNNPPDWMNLYMDGLVLRCNPDENQNGSSEVDLKVEDPDGAYDEATLDVYIDPVNDNPVVTREAPSNQNVSTTQGNEEQFTAHGFDVDANLQGFEWYYDDFDNSFYEDEFSWGPFEDHDENTTIYTHEFQEYGEHTITCQMDDEQGGTNSISWTVNVERATEYVTFNVMDHQTGSLNPAGVNLLVYEENWAGDEPLFNDIFDAGYSLSWDEAPWGNLPFELYFDPSDNITEYWGSGSITVNDENTSFELERKAPFELGAHLPFESEEAAQNSGLYYTESYPVQAGENIYVPVQVTNYYSYSKTALVKLYVNDDEVYNDPIATHEMDMPGMASGENLFVYEIPLDTPDNTVLDVGVEVFTYFDGEAILTDSENGWYEFSVENTLPTVVSTEPNNEENNVSVEEDIHIKFSRPMNSNSVTNQDNWSVSDGNNDISGSIEYYDNPNSYDAYFIPDDLLIPAKTYTVTLSNAMKDIVGFNLDGNGNNIDDGSPEDDYTFSFTTESLSFTMNEPSSDIEVYTGDDLDISWSTDIDNYTDGNVKLYHDQDQVYMNGNEVFIGQANYANQSYTWNDIDAPGGDYYIFGERVIGGTVQANDYSSGLVTVNDEHNIEMELYRVSKLDDTPNDDTPGTEKTTFYPGDSVRITMKATNAGTQVPVQCVLNIYDPSDQTVYDSYQLNENNSVDSPLGNNETDYYSFDWQIPENTEIGSYDLAGSLRNESDFDIVYETTADGANSGFSQDIRVYEEFEVVQPNYQSINIPHYHQGITNWCGYNSMSMILRYYGKNRKPWTIANDELFKSSIDEGPLPYWIQFWGPYVEHVREYMDQELSNFNVTKKAFFTGWLNPLYVYSQQIQIKNYILQHISQGKPIWAGSAKKGHASVIVGATDEKVILNDPSGAWFDSEPDIINVEKTWDEFFSTLFYPDMELWNIDMGLYAHFITCDSPPESYNGTPGSISILSYANFGDSYHGAPSIYLKNRRNGNKHSLYLFFDGSEDNNNQYGYSYQPVTYDENEGEYIIGNPDDHYNNNNITKYSSGLDDELNIGSTGTVVPNIIASNSGESRNYSYSVNLKYLDEQGNEIVPSETIELIPETDWEIAENSFDKNAPIHFSKRLAKILDPDRDGSQNNPSGRYKIEFLLEYNNEGVDSTNFQLLVENKPYVWLEASTPNQNYYLTPGQENYIPFNVSNYGNNGIDTPRLSFLLNQDDMTLIPYDVYPCNSSYEIVGDELDEVSNSLTELTQIAQNETKYYTIIAKPGNDSPINYHAFDVISTSDQTENIEVKPVEFNIANEFNLSITYNSLQYDWKNDNTLIDIDYSNSNELQFIKYQLNSNDNSAPSNWHNLTTDGETEITEFSGSEFTDDWMISNEDWESLSMSAENQGYHYIYFKVVDEAGNEYITPNQEEAFCFGKDIYPPSCNVNTPEENQVLNTQDVYSNWYAGDIIDGLELSGVNEVYYAMDQTENFTLAGENQNWATFTGLAEGEHTFYMYATDNAGNESEIIERNFTINTNVNPPQEFSLLTPSEDEVLTTQTPTLSWEFTTDPDGTNVTYDLYYSYSPDFDNQTIIEDIAGDSYQLTEPLDDNEVVYWKVKAVDEDNTIQWSNELDWSFIINTSNDAPEAFALQTPSDGELISDYTPYFNWSNSDDDDPGDDITYYLLVGQDENFSAGTYEEYETGSSSFTLSNNLEANTTYYWNVKAEDEHGSDTWASSNPYSFTTPNHEPTLSWTGEANFTEDGLNPEAGTAETTFNFKVQYADEDGDAPDAGYPELYIKNGDELTDGTPYAMTASNSDGFEDGRNYEVSVDGLTPGSNYSYYFKAYDDNNGYASGEPLEATAGPVVNGVEMISPNGGEVFYANQSINIEWSFAGDLDSFKLFYSTNNGADWNVIAEGIVPENTIYEWVIPNEPSANCLVKVEGLFGDNSTEDVSDAVFEIGEPISPPESFALLSPNGTTETTLTPEFDWEDATDPDGTNVEYELWYATNANYTNKVTIPGLSSSSYTPDQNLPDNSTIYWKVKAIDENDQVTWSDQEDLYFYTNTANNPPASFALTSPENGTEVDTFKPTFTWESSLEIDPQDEVTYTLWLGSNNQFTEGSYEAFSGIEETSYTLDYYLEQDSYYYWKVKAVDQNGEETWCYEDYRSFVTPDIPQVVIDNVDVNNYSCHNEVDGSIMISASGGMGTLQYSIDGGDSYHDNNGEFTNLEEGTYSIFVKDDNEMVVEYTDNPVEIVNPPQLEIVNIDTETSLDCYGTSNGQILIEATGGTGTLSYSVDDGNSWHQNDGQFTSLEAGNYQVKVKDENDCMVTYADNPIEITQPDEIVVNEVTSSDVTGCFNSDNGTIEVTAEGGTGSLSYSVDNGENWQSESSFSGLAIGDYQVQVKDENECIITYNDNPVAIDGPPAITFSDLSVTEVTGCYGDANGAISWTGSGGTGALQYSIDGGDTWSDEANFTELTGGEYNLAIKDENECIAEYGENPVVVNQPDEILVDVAITDVTGCCGDENGEIEITASGGTGALQYSIGGVYQDSPTFSGLAANDYPVTVKDANECEVDWSENPATINQPAELLIDNVDVQEISMWQADDGVITINASGGTGQKQYSIDGGSNWQESNVFENLTPGDYNIKVKDANDCLEIYSDNPITLEEPPQLIIENVSVTDVEGCYGDATGQIEVDAVTGTNTIYYSIDCGETWQQEEPVFENLTAGEYCVQIKNELETVMEYENNPVIIEEPEELTIPSVSHVDVEGCYGDMTGEITVTAEGGSGTLSYSIDNGDTWQEGDNHFTDLGAGNYPIVVKDAHSCETVYAENPVLITEPEELVIDNVSITQVEGCYGDMTGEIDISATGGSGTISYSIDGGSTWQEGNGLFTDLGADDGYEIMVKDAHDCYTEYPDNPVEITEPEELLIESVSTTDVEGCYGDMTGEIDIATTGGSGIINYSIDDGETWQEGDGLFTNLGADEYDILVEDAHGCQEDYFNDPVVITQPPQLEIVDVIITNVTCFGGSDGSIEVITEGGTGDIDVSIDGGTNWNEELIVDGLQAGDYSIQVNDSHECITTWSNNPAVVTQPPELVIDQVQTEQVSCNGLSDGSITISASGGTGDIQYSIDDGANWQDSGEFTGLAPEPYTVLVKDEHECVTYYGENQVIVPEPEPVEITNIEITDATCNGAGNGMIDIEATGGTGNLYYSIDNGETWQESDGFFYDLYAGEYNIQVKDANDCLLDYSQNPVTVDEPSAITIQEVDVNNVSCNGAQNGSIEIEANGGTGQLEYSIGTGGWQSSGVFEGLAPGIYEISVRDDNACLTSYDGNPVEITQPEAMSYTNVDVTGIDCYGSEQGSIIASAEGGTGDIMYSISNGNSWQDNGTFEGLGAGTYHLLIKDANDCQLPYDMNPIVIEQPEELVITGVGKENITCYGQQNGSITVYAEGGTGSVLYSINDGSNWQESEEFTGLSEGDYTVKVKDDNECMTPWQENPVTINEPDELVFGNVNVTEISCNDEADGIIEINAQGGVGSLQYSIDGGDNYSPESVFSDLAAGEYSLKIKDANECITSYPENPVILENPEQLEVSVNAEPADEVPVGDTVQLSAATNYFVNYEWQPGGQTTSTIDVTSEEATTQEYTVTVTNGNNCTETASKAIVFTVPTGEEEISGEAQLVIIPNPSKGKFKVYIQGLHSNFSLRIYDAVGNLIVKKDDQEIENGQYERNFDFSPRPNGMYYIKVISAENEFVRKLVISR